MLSLLIFLIINLNTSPDQRTKDEIPISNISSKG
jgi:hypothetical protein